VLIPTGDLITITGNGTFDTSTPRIITRQYFSSDARGRHHVGHEFIFTRLNELVLDDDDLDMGSGGKPAAARIRPGPNPHLMVGIGKVGTIYTGESRQHGRLQRHHGPDVQELLTAVGGMFSTPRVLAGTVPSVGLQKHDLQRLAEPISRNVRDLHRMIQTPPEAASVN